MKAFLFLIIFILPLTVAKINKIESGVYSYTKTKIEKTGREEKRLLVGGETKHMTNFEILSTTIKPGNESIESQLSDSEKIIFIKEGRLEIVVKNIKKEIGPGSVVLIMPGDEHEILNKGNSPATYYTIKYKSKKPMDTERGKTAGGSVLIDWENIRFQPHDKGGIRRYFDRKSAMSERIEMHATTLNPAVKSHEPHTHEPAEIIIMMKGTTEMEIGGKIYPGEVGDVYFLGSNIPHAIRNTGSNPCMYLAFQWQ